MNPEHGWSESEHAFILSFAAQPLERRQCNTLYGQCGGIGYTGPTCCSNSVCVYSNAYYSQCLPGSTSSSTSATTTRTTTTTTTRTTTTTTTKSSTTVTTTTTTPTTSKTTTTSSPTTSCAALWAQCGGSGFTGPTTCCPGSVCTYNGVFYSQCLASTSSSSSIVSSTASTVTTTTKYSTTATSALSTAGSTVASMTTTSTGSTTKTASVTATATSTKLPYTGINESGAEWGTNIPGVLGTDYIWPSNTSIEFFTNAGDNIFRLPFLWERLQTTLNDLASLDQTISTMNAKGAIVIVEPHNYGRYLNNIIGSTAVPNSAFYDFWTKMSTHYKTNDMVWFNIMNEPNTMDTTAWFASAQGAVNAIRAAGFSNKILVPGTRWTGAWTWTTSGGTDGSANGDAIIGFTDPLNNFLVEVHQYLDSDGSGSGAECVSTTAMVDRLTSFTTWARTKGFKAWLGEIGIQNTTTCATALEGGLTYLEQNQDVWAGFTYWAAGAWWSESNALHVEPKTICGKAPCKTLVWNVLKNHCALAPKAAATPTATTSPVPKPTNTIIAYTDTALNTVTGLGDGSWGSTINFASTTIYRGTSGTSIFATLPSSTYGAFSIAYTPGLGPSSYNYWHFYISGSDSNIPNLNVGVHDSGTGVDSVPLSYFIAQSSGSVVYGTWTEIWVDLSLFNTNGDIIQVWLQDTGSGTTFYLDDISFSPTKP
ncbi:hypothetical protein HK096_003487 [Nowakowskiella sp. JEL0078]|nr:hypothetical protein HK096_003487 [Nowakowskiella sp. JEL0078]